MRSSLLRVSACVLSLSCCLAEAGASKLMALRQAELAAKRGLVESVYGVKVKSTTNVKNLVSGVFEGSAQTKSAGFLQGVKVEKAYDAEKKLARVTASLSLAQVGKLTGLTFANPEASIKRVGYSTTDEALAGAVQALRAAEVDAYVQLAEALIGCELESRTTIRNYMMESDEITSKVMAAIFMAEVVDMGWEGDDADAYVKVRLDVDKVGRLIGQKLAVSGVLEVVGQGAAVNDLVTKETAEAKESCHATQ